MAHRLSGALGPYKPNLRHRSLHNSSPCTGFAGWTQHAALQRQTQPAHRRLINHRLLLKRASTSINPFILARDPLATGLSFRQPARNPPEKRAGPAQGHDQEPRGRTLECKARKLLNGWRWLHPSSGSLGSPGRSHRTLVRETGSHTGLHAMAPGSGCLSASHSQL
ncbi:hypothetical protein PtA15_13A399 [Puccinia triticina]|uniref:Uncharacterized protein n=1 Tax=Puccinia triticina TaxID=208348 RepID=A0ABY7D2C7_9BASI|nr:uncharacterized protein PtA15_13A399 [Puccinia triticina]WAQ90999.1 hypothetical protein PtA15_13A399 [Puccinia triticina]WAR61189.1 hypothetical protein PtB15_13B441 [Puccinia triticina]